MMRPGKLLRKINFYPPYLGMGIRVESVADDLTRFDVVLRARWYNRNLYGAHFGGSLYAMSDPFYVLIIAMNLGSDYAVWDKSAHIDFLKPAEGSIRARFEIRRARIQTIRREVDERGKRSYHFETDLFNRDEVAVAHVEKEVHVKKIGPE